MPDKDDNQTAGSGLAQNSEPQKGLASLQESSTMPMTPSSDAMTFDSNTMQREIDRISRQLDGISKSVRRLGRAF